MSTTNKVVELVDLQSICLPTYVAEDNFASLSQCVTTQICKIDQVNDHGQTALHVSCELGKLEFANFLLDNAANIHAIDADGSSSLICAVKGRNVECVELCLNRKADIEHTDEIGWTALMWASYKGYCDIFKILIHREANIFITSAFNMNPLLWSAGRGFYDIVDILCHKNAKINSTDKFGSNALYWACRKGFNKVVTLLLEHGADPDAVGANGANSLIVSARFKHTECVKLLLTKTRVNPNQIDKDSNSALMYSAKQGCHKSMMLLLERGAYLSMTDQHGDTPLIKSVKHGHVLCVRELLAHYADVNVKGRGGKTALHWACDIGHIAIAKELLACDPNTEVTTDDGETVLIRAVKNKNVTLTRLLLDNGANVSAVDSKHDTAIHVAVRARSMRLVEILLRNPSDSRLLYVSNKKGETPYNMDAAHNKSILLNIFGSKNLSPETLTNVADDSALQSYTLYSSALADILCEPTLAAPLTVGLYAKWGSGKSFLLEKLKEQIKVFTGSNKPPFFRVVFLPFIFVMFICLFLGLFTSFLAPAEARKIVGYSIGFSLFAIYLGFIGLISMGNNMFRWKWAVSFGTSYALELQYLHLLWKLWFTNPRHQVVTDGKAIPVRFLFTNYSRLTSVGGETSLAEMIGNLSYNAEKHLGFLAVRVYRAIKPDFQRKRYKEGSLKMLCCVPTFVLALLFVLSTATLIILIVVLYGPNPVEFVEDSVQRNVIYYFILVTGCVSGALLLLASPLIFRIIEALLFSQRHRVLQAAHVTKSSERLMQQMKHEVDMLGEAVMAIDAVAKRQTRMCIIINGLDSCEQDNVLHILDAVSVLFAQRRYRFITILAIDPNIIIKAIDNNLNSMFRDSSITGHDYLKNIIHLPFYMRDKNNKLLRKHKSLMHIRDLPADSDDDEGNNFERGGSFLHKGSRNSRRKKNFDLLKDIFHEDWFNSISPQLMRRILNIVSLTGRLLRAEGIDFSWSRLAAWVNLTEQWPYRASWFVNLIENGNLRTNKTIKAIFDDNFFPSHDPLLCIDSSDERSFKNFISGRNLTVRDIRSYIACTVNLDPNLREVISMEPETDHPIHAPVATTNSGASTPAPAPSFDYVNSTHAYRRKRSIIERHNSLDLRPRSTSVMDWTVEDVCGQINIINGLSPKFKDIFTNFVQSNNISGSALIACEISELRQELPKMQFGDWALLKRWLIEIRSGTNLQQQPPTSFNESQSLKSFNKTLKTQSEKSDGSPNENKMSVLSLESLQFETLRAQERFAYDNAFKEYLKLQPASSNARKENNIATISSGHISPDDHTTSNDNTDLVVKEMDSSNV